MIEILFEYRWWLGGYLFGMVSLLWSIYGTEDKVKNVQELFVVLIWPLFLATALWNKILYC